MDVVAFIFPSIHLHFSFHLFSFLISFIFIFPFFSFHLFSFFHSFICIFHFIYLPISQKNSTFASAFINKVGNDFAITTKA